MMLSGIGIANILIFRNHAYTQLRISASECDEDLDFTIKKLAKRIATESTEKKGDTSTFD